MKIITNIIFLVSVFGYGYCNQVLFEGESCRNNDGSTGVCRKQKDCKTLEQDVKAGKRPKVCSFDFVGPIFCCATSTTVPTYKPPQGHYNQNNKPQQQMLKAIAKAKKKCVEYAKSVFIEIDSPVFEGDKERINQCAILEEALILGGEKTKAKEFPHMALIGFGSNINRVKWSCGGSLVSDRFVLTAAHCSNTKKGPAKWVKLGELDTSTNEDDADPQVFNIIKRIDHPGYNADKSLYNDLSLFQLDRIVIFNAYIRPICLSTKSTLDIHTAIATGWGHTQWAGTASDTMLKVKLDLISNQECKRKLNINNNNKLPQNIIESQMCAGSQEGKDTCQGDSGGPLQSPLKDVFCMYELLGITSFGKGCGLGFPGVYTKVIAFLPWIVNTVWPE